MPLSRRPKRSARLSTGSVLAARWPRSTVRGASGADLRELGRAPGRRSEVGMPIEFEPDFRWDISTQTMKFYARHGRRRIRCAVTGPALEDRVRAHGLGAAGLERAFREHRQDIERKASDKIRTGRFQADGTILIRTRDLNP